MIIWTSLLFFVITYFGEYVNVENLCGIPVISWIEGFFIVICSLGCSMVIMMAVALITRDSNKTGIALFVLIFIWLYTMAGWTIYGYKLFNSEENNCGLVRETTSWNTAMIIFMIIGTLFVFYASIFTCILPCILFAVIIQQRSH